jgi:hypothetical protein
MWRTTLLFSSFFMALTPAYAVAPSAPSSLPKAEAPAPVDPLARPEPSFDEVKNKLQVTPDIIWSHINTLRVLQLENEVLLKQEELAKSGQAQ